MQRVKVKPTRELTIRDDVGLVIPSEGKVINKSVRIMRLVRDGDLEIEDWVETPKKRKGGK